MRMSLSAAVWGRGGAPVYGNRMGLQLSTQPEYVIRSALSLLLLVFAERRHASVFWKIP